MSTKGRRKKVTRRYLAALWKFADFFPVDAEGELREMRNKFGGVCYRCHKYAAPGEGHFERHRGGWRVQHVSCCLITRDGVSAFWAQKIQEKKPKKLSTKDPHHG